MDAMKNTPLHFLILVGWLTSLLAGCAFASTSQPNATPVGGPISLTDSLGHTVTLAGPAQRVVSLSPSNTEILFAIGAGGQVVGRDAFSDYPEDAKTVPVIGGDLGELNFEVILAQKPDLVLASELTPIEQIASMQEFGMTVFALANPKDFPGMFESLRTVASLTGHNGEAQSLIAGLESRLQRVEEKIRLTSTRPLVFYEIDGTDPNAPWTPGPGSFVDTMIRIAGGDNLGDSLDSEWAQISVEALLAEDPDIILIGDAVWGGVTLESVRSRPGWDQSKAIQDGSMYVFDDNLVSRPGPRMIDGLEGLARLFHPELFE
jgi:iron complex transport system substrate-binding protein